MKLGRSQIAVALILVAVLGAGIWIVSATGTVGRRIHVTAYFANSKGIYPGDDVRILGIPVGSIDSIEEQPDRVKVDFSYDAKYDVPADVNAVILSPALVAVRAIQLTPAYTGGSLMADDAVIPQDRTAVPVEWDDVRQQLLRLSKTLQPTQPGGVSPLGSLINTAADNLRGRGADIRQALVKMSQAFSALGDHSTDLFSSVKNISILVSALQASTDLMRQLNGNFAAVTSLLANTPDEVGNAVADINSAVGDVQTFIAENKEPIGVTGDKLASITTALNQSLDDIKQALHIAPGAFQNLMNIYQPAQGTLSGALAINNFANPITFLCGAIQAASRLGAEQSAKLCVQYLAPIIKNRQYNFPPIGVNPFVGTTARPNELTYSEDWLRPDYVPPPAAPAADVAAQPTVTSPLPAEQGAQPEAQQTDPAAGLPGLMIPAGPGA